MVFLEKLIKEFPQYVTDEGPLPRSPSLEGGGEYIWQQWGDDNLSGGLAGSSQLCHGKIRLGYKNVSQGHESVLRNGFS